MCTVTLAPESSGIVRMVCNRDELRTRTRAAPPARESFGARRAILPRDPDAGGTWIAVSDAALVFTLLNLNLDAAPSPPDESIGSRGRLIPELLDAPDLVVARDRLRSFHPGRQRPFRLVVTDGAMVVCARSDGHTVTVTDDALDRPLMWTSSGLGDALVETPRRALFDSWVAAEPFTPARQDAFHRHAWPDRMPLSVRMSRADARTVSCTTIELAPGRATLRYADEAPDFVHRGAPIDLELLPARRT